MVCEGGVMVVVLVSAACVCVCVCCCWSRGVLLLEQGGLEVVCTHHVTAVVERPPSRVAFFFS